MSCIPKLTLDPSAKNEWEWLSTKADKIHPALGCLMEVVDIVTLGIFELMWFGIFIFKQYADGNIKIEDRINLKNKNVVQENTPLKKEKVRFVVESSNRN